MFIYEITNKVNGKKYIGLTTKTIDWRWKRHTEDSKGGVGVLARAICKYGKDNFEVKQLCSSETIEDLKNMEKVFIAFKNTLVPNGYNLTLGGDGALGLSRPDLALDSAYCKSSLARELVSKRFRKIKKIEFKTSKPCLQKFTDTQIKNIYLAQGTCSEIAKKFNTSASYVCSIKLKRSRASTTKDLKEP